jgi:cobalt-zinc-cadmium efflux system membrane fusion protein
MNLKITLMCLLIIILAPIFPVLTANAQMLTINEQEQKLLGIQVQTVNAIDQGSASEITMRVAFAADGEWAIKTPLSGVLHRVFVQQGDRVKQGDKLVVVRSAEMVALQRDYLKAHAEFNLQVSNLKRDQKLGEAGSISERRWNETRYEHDTAQAEYAGLRGQLKLVGLSEDGLKQLLERMEIGPDIILRSPADAVVLARPAMLGEQLNGSELLVRLGETEKLILEGDLSSISAANLQTGGQITQKGSGNRAEFTFVSKVIDPQSQTVHVRAQPVKIGMLAAGQLTTWEVLSGASFLTVPSSAVVKLGDKDVVYLANSVGFETREVQVKSTGKGAWLVLDGLVSGDRVAVVGISVLKGMSMGLGGGDE